MSEFILQIESDHTTHDGIVDEGISHCEARGLKHLVICLELRGIITCVMLIFLTRCGNGCLTSWEVLEINQHTFMVIKHPKQVDLTMYNLTRKWLNEWHLMLDRRGFAICSLQPSIEMLNGSNDLVDIRYDFIHVVAIANIGGLLYILFV